MIHRFQHTFADGEKTQLAIDTSYNPPRFASSPRKAHHDKEYQQWLHEIVVPQIVTLLNPAQLDTCAKVGMKVTARALAQ